MEFNKAMCKILNLSHGSLKQKYSLCDKEIDSSPKERELGALMDEILKMS